MYDRNIMRILCFCLSCIKYNPYNKPINRFEKQAYNHGANIF